MVDLEKIEVKLSELEAFFEKILHNPSNVDNNSYGAGADYGLKSVKEMKNILVQYRKKPQNRHLKQLDSEFSSVTRGVEGFNDYGLDKKFREICEEIYWLKKDLGKHIKW